MLDYLTTRYVVLVVGLFPTCHRSMVTTVHTAITSAVIRPTAVAVAQVVVVMTVGVAVGHLMTHAVGGVGSRSSRMVAVLVAVGIAQAGVAAGQVVVA